MHEVNTRLTFFFLYSWVFKLSIRQMHIDWEVLNTFVMIETKTLLNRPSDNFVVIFVLYPAATVGWYVRCSSSSIRKKTL